MKHPFPPWRRCCVYTVTHRGKGDSYVGITVNVSKRWSEHRKLIEKFDRRLDTRFYRSLKKHGVDAFDWKVIQWYESESHAKSVEIAMIATGNFCLNTTKGGDGISDPTGKIRRKIASKLKGRRLSEAHKKAISLTLTGRVKSPEECRNISIGKTGRKRPPVSEETRRRLRQASLRRKLQLVGENT